MKKQLMILILLTTIIFSLTAKSNKELEENNKQNKEIIKVSWNEKESSNYQKPSTEVLKYRLTPLQFNVTQKNDTERAFNNIYWDNHEDGIYVDIVSGEALFSSLDKYESGTGWPSFTKSIHQENIILETDKSFGITRVEVRSLNADSHLGHLFNDGPEPTGERYCINSASLRFIPLEDMEDEGYNKYLNLFK